MVCVSERSSSSSMAWRTLFSDGVADMAGICTVGSGAAGFGAGGAVGAGCAGPARGPRGATAGGRRRLLGRPAAGRARKPAPQSWGRRPAAFGGVGLRGRGLGRAQRVSVPPPWAPQACGAAALVAGWRRGFGARLASRRGLAGAGLAARLRRRANYRARNRRMHDRRIDRLEVGVVGR